MKADKVQWLRDEMVNLELAATHLRFSLDRSRELIDRPVWSLEELERLESLTSRFARLADLLVQRVLRLIDDLELSPRDSVLDRIQRAEKRGLFEESGQLMRIRELRNLIALMRFDADPVRARRRRCAKVRQARLQSQVFRIDSPDGHREQLRLPPLFRRFDLHPLSTLRLAAGR